VIQQNWGALLRGEKGIEMRGRPLHVKKEDWFVRGGEERHGYGGGANTREEKQRGRGGWNAV